LNAAHPRESRASWHWPRAAWLLLLLLPAYYEVSAWRLAGALGFPLDDAWIHAQFARNLATGHGFTYTGPQWVAGSTAPAWTVLLAAGYFCVRSALLAGKILGVVLYVLGAGLTARLILRLTGGRGIALAGGLIVGALPAMTWGAVSGMEVPLAVCLTTGAFLAYLTSRALGGRLLAFVLFSLAVLSRPETLAILGVVAVHYVATSRGLRGRLMAVALVVAAAVVVLGPVVLFDLWTTGRPLPTTFYAKSGPGLVRAVSAGDHQQLALLFQKHGPTAVWRFGETLVEQLGLLAPVVFLGMLSACWSPVRQQGGALVLASVVAAAFSMGLVAPQRLKPENFRYTAQFLTLAVTVGISGLACWRPVVRWRSLGAAALAICVAAGVHASVSKAPDYALSVKNINELHVRLAGWMRSHLAPGSRVAVNDVGALAYFGGHEVIDLEGLVSPDSLRVGRAERGIGVTARTRPDYVAIFPSWYPDIAARPDLFREVYRVSIADNLVSAGSVIVVYSTPWTRYPPIRRPPERPRRRWPA
jgi:hypothetical protein